MNPCSPILFHHSETDRWKLHHGDTRLHLTYPLLIHKWKIKDSISREKGAIIFFKFLMKLNCLFLKCTEKSENTKIHWKTGCWRLADNMEYGTNGLKWGAKKGIRPRTLKSGAITLAVSYFPTPMIKDIRISPLPTCKHGLIEGPVAREGLSYSLLQKMNFTTWRKERQELIRSWGRGGKGGEYEIYRQDQFKR